MNPVMAEQEIGAIRERHERLAAALATERALRVARPAAAGVRARAMLRLGDALIGLGQGLKAWQRPIG